MYVCMYMYICAYVYVFVYLYIYIQINETIEQLKTALGCDTTGFACFYFQEKNLKKIKILEKHLKPVVSHQIAVFT